MKNQQNKTVGVFTLRVLLGLIFVMQGGGKVFTYGVNNVYHNFFSESFKDTFLPEFVLQLTAYYTSYVELIAGFFLTIGLFTSYSLYLLASVLIIVTFGHGLIEPIWNLDHLLARTLLLIPLLLLPREWDQWSADAVIKRMKK